VNSSKGLKNILYGLIAQVITIGMGIIIPRLVLVNLGSESNGLLNSVSNILTYMSLLEAGVGTATLQALYKPIAEEDKNSVSSIMAATHYFYKRTGYIYFVIVVVLSIVYTLFVKTTLSRIYIFLVVLLAGLSGVLSYFFQGKYKILLAAEGKGYISTNITTITTVGTSLVKALILMVGGNVVAIQATYFVFNLIQMIFFSVYIYKNYRWLDLKVTPRFEAISQKNAVLVHQITELIFNNTDVIILTVFTSLSTVSVYSMYAMIFGMVKSVTVTLSDSFLYVLGQSFEDKEKFVRMHNIYEVFNMAFTFALFCIAGILILPFLSLYTEGVNDINYVDKYVAVLFILFYLLANGRKSSQIVINIAQHFEKTKWRAVTEATINIFVSILFTYKFGIYGVLLGTVAALVYRANDVIIYAARLMERSPLVTYKRWGANFVIFVAIMWIASVFEMNLSNYWYLCIYGVVLCLTIIPVFVIINSLLEPDTARYAFGILKNMLSGKVKKK